MDINLSVKDGYLIPASDDDFKKKLCLKKGQTYKAKIVLYRNYDFHRKYFAMINAAWEYVEEAKQERFFHNSVDQFRQTIQMTAGHSDKIFSYELKTFIDIPRSISFEKMDNDEFSDLYDRVKAVLWSLVLDGKVSEKDFDKLIEF